MFTSFLLTRSLLCAYRMCACVCFCVCVCTFVIYRHRPTKYIYKKKTNWRRKKGSNNRPCFDIYIYISYYCLCLNLYIFLLIFSFLFPSLLAIWFAVLLVCSLPAGKNNHNNNNNHNNRHCNYDTASHCYVCGFDISILDQPICVFGEMTYHDLCSIARLRLLVPPHARAPALSATHWSEMNNKLNYFNASVSFFSRSSANSRSYCTQQRLFFTRMCMDWCVCMLNLRFQHSAH